MTNKKNEKILDKIIPVCYIIDRKGKEIIKMKTIEELKNEIERVEHYIFLETMADFMNWDYYYKLKRELNDLKKELKEREG